MEAADCDLYKYKSKLHEYAQRNNHPCPVYTVEKEGFPHAPQFRATVCVAGQVFKSSQTFRRVKDAEHAVARLAFEALTSQNQSEVGPTLLQDIDIIRSKSILYEYNVKKGLYQPVYKTNAPAGEPGFISQVEIEGNSYNGPISKTKKDAEQYVAHLAITSILENSESKGLMMEIIRSKCKARPALNANPNPNPNTGILDNSESRNEETNKNMLLKGANDTNQETNKDTVLKVANHPNQETDESTDLKATDDTNQETDKNKDLKAANDTNQEANKNTDLKAGETVLTDPIESIPMSENNCVANCETSNNYQLVGPVKSKTARKRTRKNQNKQLVKKLKTDEESQV